MAGVVQNEASFIRVGRPRTVGVTPALLSRVIVFANPDSNTVVVFGESGLGKLHLQLAEDIHCCANGVGIFGDAARHFQEDAANLHLLFFQQPHQFIILLDGFERFHEDGLSTGTGAVNDPLNAAFLLGFDGDDESFAANGDQFVLDCTSFGQTAQITSQRLLNETLLTLDLSADAGEFR